MEILIPSLLRIKPHSLYKIGKYVRDERFDKVVVFYGEGIQDLLSETIHISFASSEITALYEGVVRTNDIETAFQSAKGLPSQTCAIVAVGGGKAIDFCKYIGFINQIPVISVPTIISNDGFCSPMASLWVDQRRRTVKTRIPYGIILDTAIIRGAPEKFLYSGIGDLFCKVTSLFDWKLAYHENNEPLNDFASVISKNAVEPFLYYPKKEFDDLAYIGVIASGLLMSGIAMQIADSSRPASGSEHLISHAYDKVASEPSLHGLQVGVASYAVSYLQKDTYPVLKQIIQDCGFLDFMTQNPLHKEDFIKAIYHAPEIKENFYTILSRKNNIEYLVDFMSEDPFMQDMLYSSSDN